jgi:hypothetical protein
MASIPPWQRAVIAIVRPPVILLRFVFGSIYDLLFSRMDLRAAQERKKDLELEIRYGLPFLFTEWNAAVVSEPLDPKNVPPFDYAVVTLSVGLLFLHFTSGREEFVVQVAREPTLFHELTTLLCAMDVSPTVRRNSVNSIDQARSILKEYLPEISRAFSGTEYVVIKVNLDDIYARDRVITKQLETEINRRLYAERQ